VSEWRDLPGEPRAAPDPWSDQPVWSDDSATPGPVDGGAAEAATTDPAGQDRPAADAPAPAGALTCSWCATVAPDGATRCPSCDAALAQRESIGDLVIPGLTSVDPALQDYASRPMHISGPSPSQGVASGAIVAAAAGGPLGLAIIGGIGVVAAAEYLGANRGPGAAPIGETSEAVRQALERLERGEKLPAANETTPRPELDAAPGPSEANVTREERSDG
jgi:hypothetical protein